jgi:hypothetical protein
MGRGILVIALLMVLAVFAYMGYNSYDARRSGASGEVFSREPLPEKRKGDTVLSASPDSGSASRQTASSPTSAADTKPVTPEQTPAQLPAQISGPTPDQIPAQTPSGQATQAASSSPPPSTANSARDTISPNPPNGMVFSGSGHYQLYRQGNLTWRLNTDSGQSCVLFATDAEWKKPRVYRAGCGKHANKS